jgi:flagellar biosynthesis protein FlhB
LNFLTGDIWRISFTARRNIALARALAKELDVGDAVPVKWYQAVAEILSMVYKLKKPAA